MSEIGLLCLLDDVDAQVALGLAQCMCPFSENIILVDFEKDICFSSSSEAFSERSLVDESNAALAKVLLAEVGISLVEKKSKTANAAAFERGILIIPRLFDLDEFRKNRLVFSHERWEHFIVGTPKGGFKLEGLAARRIMRGQLRDGLQHFFRRSEGLFFDEEKLF